MKSFLCLVGLIGLLTVSGVSYAQTTPASTPAADSTTLQSYVGTYTFNSGSPIQKFTVTTEKGELYGEADDFGKNRLVKQAGADTYKSTSSYGSIITFVRDAATRTITSLTLAAQGAELTAKKATP
ncbi:DUF3471 domain-containing protein [Spirosoma taeanense]|uniref:DUF3471 domain-containing protein n=1 Tax=Spirosoma taeanense TaxID=2735870 RepID=A0A6M5Y611_9BACT|nr:DUF3471 domain-containing protein [Spirosoma taeanense]QJW89878.1 DUF3471 domain-containing protein [Spirosoma taeanense]